MRFLFSALCFVFLCCLVGASMPGTPTNRRVAGGSLGVDDALPWLPADHPFRSDPLFNRDLHSNDRHPSFEVKSEEEENEGGENGGGAHQEVHWTYERSNLKEGPIRGWEALEPKCGGSAQTPIDIDPSSVVYDVTLPPLRLNWRAFNNGTLVHNGHSLQFSPHPSDLLPSTIRTAKGGALPAPQYNLLQFHIHITSEHRVGKGSYAMELHAVHQNNDPKQAVETNPNELAVIGLLFYETEEDNSLLQPFIEAANRIDVDKKILSTSLSFNLQALIPNDRSYYTYHGSLTTPNCRETVTWHLIREPIPIGARQMEAIIKAQGFSDNYRPVQPLNGRVVKTNGVMKLFSDNALATGASIHGCQVNYLVLGSALMIIRYIFAFLSF